MDNDALVDGNIVRNAVIGERHLRRLGCDGNTLAHRKMNLSGARIAATIDGGQGQGVVALVFDRCGAVRLRIVCALDQFVLIKIGYFVCNTNVITRIKIVGLYAADAKIFEII